MWSEAGSNTEPLSFPTRIVIDKEGVAYISDTANHRILRYAVKEKATARLDRK
jgi:hypothetical protein